MAKKRLPDSYTFDASAKTIVHASFSDITLAGIQVIVNVTDQIIIYNFADPNKGGTLATDTLTLDFDTTSMSDTDELMILVDDGLDQTVNLGSTDNAVLDAIAASVAAIDTDTTTIIGHVDGIEGLLTTIDTDTGNIATAVQLIDDSIFTAGTDTYTEATSKGQLLLAVRRDADTTLANTTNEFTPLQVDANGYLKVEVFSGATLPVSLTSTTITGTVAVTQSGTWDEVGINDSGNSITVDNGGTFAVQVDGAALTALQLLDDAIYVDDADWTDSTSKHALVGGLYQSSPQTVTDGDVAPFNITANGAMHVAVQNTVTVGSHAVTNAGTFVVQENGSALTALQLIDDVIYVDDADWTDGTSKHALVGGLYQSAPQTVTDGDVAPFLTDANGRLQVALSPTDNGVLDNIDADLTTIIGHVDGIEGLLTTIDADTGNIATNTSNAATSLAVMDDWDNGASDGASVSGDVAHDTADAGEPVKIGMKAVALKANPTEVAAGDRTNWYADVSGVPFVLGGHPNILTQSLQVTDADGAQTDTAIITAGANVAIVVTKVSVMADNANTNDVSVRIGLATTNTPAADAAQVILFHPGIAPGSGVVEGTGSGIIGIGASGEDVRVTCEDPVGGSINIIVTYFTTDI